MLGRPELLARDKGRAPSRGVCERLRSKLGARSGDIGLEDGREEGRPDVDIDLVRRLPLSPAPPLGPLVTEPGALSESGAPSVTEQRNTKGGGWRYGKGRGGKTRMGEMGEILRDVTSSGRTWTFGHPFYEHT